MTMSFIPSLEKSATTGRLIGGCDRGISPHHPPSWADRITHDPAPTANIKGTCSLSDRSGKGLSEGAVAISCRYSARPLEVPELLDGTLPHLA
eukprot:CAMPEP_0175123630 /NCGR_PEP_ID=MMETSP0087-20121206/2347_1 /TAXON_ID=136419 /ORGANISM="Unknown Unknown, Strain D1" /LENGTH=92 /DNA_ID=CAMNT_0016405337 /DNA_START=258 /DNA_END=533 /DNA_ORIENTATION=+